MNQDLNECLTHYKQEEYESHNSLTQSDSVASDSSESEEIHHEHEASIEEEEEVSITHEDYEEESEQEEPDAKQVKANELYRQNCLAAAQMMQLMCSTNATSSSIASSSSSASSTTSSVENHSSTEASPNSGLIKTENENEKENIPICKYCNKIFANFSNLNHHISAIHLNQSKWVCSQCGKICSSKSNLKVHLRVHLRVKPYHCRWCSYSCMHHSSIRDHLAKVHPDQTHTPLQPGYLFNSQAVPEPEVFNSKGFSVNTFVTDSRSKRTSESLNDSNTNLYTSPDAKRSLKKNRTETTMKPNGKNNQAAPSFKVVQPPSNIQTPPPSTQQMPNLNQNQANVNASANISNLYNAYTMARMFPFMYHPMQMQYANNASTNGMPMQLNQPSHSSPTSSFLGILNQNLMQYNMHQSRSANNSNLQSTYSSGIATQDHSGTSSSSSNPNHIFSTLYNASTSNNNSSSDDHQTNSSGNLSYSASSRSSSLSPSNKASSNDMSSIKPKQTSSASTSIEVEYKLSNETNEIHVNSNNFQAQPKAVVKKSFNIDQMLNTKSTREMETQTESSCLSCPYCNNSCF